MKKLFLLLIPCVAFAGTEPINLDTATGHVKKTSSGTGVIAKPISFCDVAVSGIPFLSLADTPSTYVGQAGKIVKVNPGETGLIFGTGGGGGGVFIDLDFTGNNLTFMNGTTMWKSTGDSDDPITFPYTATNSGIIVKDANNVEVFRIWASDPDSTHTNGGNTFIGQHAGELNTTGSKNTAIGWKAMENVTTGSHNTSVGLDSGAGYSTGSNNIFIGDTADTLVDVSDATAVGTFSVVNANGGTALGKSAQANGVNSIAIGQFANADDDNIMALGHQSITDIYCGYQTNNSSVHATVHAEAFVGDGSTLSNIVPASRTLTIAGTTQDLDADRTFPIVGGFTAHFSRGGAAIQANDVILTPWTCPYSGTITGYSISADTGTCTLKTWKKANGTAIPTIADVISTSGVALSSGTHVRSSTVSDFTTTTVTAGDMFMAQVTATSGATDITFQVEITR